MYKLLVYLLVAGAVCDSIFHTISDKFIDICRGWKVLTIPKHITEWVEIESFVKEKLKDTDLYSVVLELTCFEQELNMRKGYATDGDAIYAYNHSEGLFRFEPELAETSLHEDFQPFLKQMKRAESHARIFGTGQSIQLNDNNKQIVFELMLRECGVEFEAGLFKVKELLIDSYGIWKAILMDGHELRLDV